MNNHRNFSLITVVRNKNHTYSFKSGKSASSLIVILKGKMTYVFKNTRLTISKGAVLYIPPHLPYTAIYNEDGTNVCIFGFESDKNIFASPYVKSDVSLPQAFSHISKVDSGNNYFVAARIYDLLYILEKDTDEIPPKYKKILPAIKEINKNYSQNHSLSYYAQLCDMSESNLRRLIKEYTGFSLVDYRNRLRINQAKKLIDSGEFTVNEAAYEVGFNNMSFFYKVYNRMFKMKTK